MNLCGMQTQKHFLHKTLLDSAYNQRTIESIWRELCGWKIKEVLFVW